MLVENVFNIHGLLASCLGALIWAFTILYHSSASAAAAPQVVTVWIVHGALTMCLLYQFQWCVIFSGLHSAIFTKKNKGYVVHFQQNISGLFGEFSGLCGAQHGDAHSWLLSPLLGQLSTQV